MRGLGWKQLRNLSVGTKLVCLNPGNTKIFTFFPNSGTKVIIRKLKDESETSLSFKDIKTTQILHYSWVDREDGIILIPTGKAAEVLFK